MKFRSKKKQFFSFLLITTLTALIVVGIGIYLTNLSFPFSTDSNSLNKTNSSQKEQADSNFKNNSSIQSKSICKVDTKTSKQQNTSNNQTCYGHFSYKMADPEQMMLVASYATGKYQRFESLHPEAAKALMRMIYAARDDGVWIVPVSGFRTLEKQKRLFQAQVERLGSEKKAAEVSAPPGYSEHHTGFAIDLTDGKYPKKDITNYFQKTEAYDWLTKNANRFDYELSFPRNNSQGISFEPWHWRYIGTQKAKQVFGKGK